MLLLEAGLGGIYDATNVVDPLVAVITGIDYDHCDYLGESLQEIACNKAGIIKAYRPVVAGLMPNEAFKVINDTARPQNAPLYKSDIVQIKRRGSAGLDGQWLDINYGQERFADIFFALLGDYQLENLATALTTVMILQDQGFNIPAAAVKNALAGLKHAGRMEIISTQPLVILDAAHNPQGARALSQSLEQLLPGKTKILVCGLLDDKDLENTLAPLMPCTRLCVVTRPASPRGRGWQRIEGFINKHYPGMEHMLIEDNSKAVEKALGLRKENEYLLVAGSFYILDQCRRYLLTQPS